jgi:hypothetical protein
MNICLAWAIKGGFKDDKKKNPYNRFSRSCVPAIMDVAWLAAHAKKEDGSGNC